MLRDFFERVRKANLSLKPRKCKIGLAEVGFLGHTLQKDTVGPQKETVGHILEADHWPTKKKEIMYKSVRMINFYGRYIPNCAEIIAPLTELTKGRSPNVEKWGDRWERAFKEVKQVLSNEPILKLPDLNREFMLQTDASNQSLGGCLLQEYDGIKHPVFYASRKLIQREHNYSGGEREALMIISAVSNLHQYACG